jgi:hypothetical protein
MKFPGNDNRIPAIKGHSLKIRMGGERHEVSGGKSSEDAQCANAGVDALK